MKRLGLVIAASALVAAVPAWAAKPPHPTHPTHPAHPSKSSSGSSTSKSCKTLAKGFNARGTVVSATLTAGVKKGRYDGSLSVDEVRANHKGATGDQTFTLTEARVHFGKGVASTTVAAGDRVWLHGKVTSLPHGCSTTGFTATTTVRDVTIKAPSKA